MKLHLSKNALLLEISGRVGWIILKLAIFYMLQKLNLQDNVAFTNRLPEVDVNCWNL